MLCWDWFIGGKLWADWRVLYGIRMIAQTSIIFIFESAPGAMFQDKGRRFQKDDSHVEQ